jgi:hypothetical protein
MPFTVSAQPVTDLRNEIRQACSLFALVGAYLAPPLHCISPRRDHFFRIELVPESSLRTASQQVRSNFTSTHSPMPQSFVPYRTVRCNDQSNFFVISVVLIRFRNDVVGNLISNPPSIAAMTCDSQFITHDAVTQILIKPCRYVTLVSTYPDHWQAITGKAVYCLQLPHR